jgi:hypothetical protein
MPRSSQLLDEAANAAFQNAVQLFEEAKLLCHHKKWARSYALALLAAEQYTKSFEFKCEQIGFRLPNVPDREVHEFRLLRFTFLLILPHLMSVGGYNLFAKLANVSLREPDRKLMKRAYSIFGKDTDRKKELAFYVDLNAKLRIPSNEIKKKDCKEVLEVMEDTIGAKPFFLTERGEQLKSALALSYFPLFDRSQSELFKLIGRQYLRGA